MQQTEIQLRAADGLGLFAQEWQPDTERRGVVCFVHGLGEHGGRYGPMAEVFADKGLALLAIDQRGHGRSDGKRGHTPHYSASLDDIDALLEGAAIRHPGLPRFLYGHSLGGNLVLNHALRRQPEVNGVVATGPWLRLTHEPTWYKRLLASIVEPFWPSLTFNTAGDKQQVKQILGEVAPPEVSEPNPLSHDQITLRLLMEARRAGRWAIRHADLLKVPTLILHGTLDGVTNPFGSAEFGRRAGAACTVEILEGIAHNVHEEDDGALGRIGEWLSAHLRGGTNGHSSHTL